jgi:pimeloyl-ACP methyl ester carboxylesterase
VRRNFIGAVNPGKALTRMLWLPGAYNAAEDFVQAGFGEAVARRRLPLDLEFIDLELRYLGDDGALVQLRDEVVRPLQAAGIEVWLGGISLGGLLALHFAATISAKLAGLCLLAPYMGNRMLIEEILRAPGLKNWQPGETLTGDAERQVWRYIQLADSEAIPLYLGYGRQDRFAAGLQLLADNLAPKAVNAIEGGHDWQTWAVLWGNFLDSRFT